MMIAACTTASPPDLRDGRRFIGGSPSAAAQRVRDSQQYSARRWPGAFAARRAFSASGCGEGLFRQ